MAACVAFGCVCSTRLSRFYFLTDFQALPHRVIKDDVYKGEFKWELWRIADFRQFHRWFHSRRNGYLG
jgi:glutathionyl-hydroquinone reductase